MQQISHNYLRRQGNNFEDICNCLLSQLVHLPNYQHLVLYFLRSRYCSKHLIHFKFSSVDSDFFHLQHSLCITSVYKFRIL